MVKIKSEKLKECPNLVFDFFYNEGVVLRDNDVVTLHTIETDDKIIRVYETTRSLHKLEITAELRCGKTYKLMLRYNGQYKYINRYFYDKFGDMIGSAMYRPQSYCFKKLKWGRVPKRYKKFKDINNELGGCGRNYDMFACYVSKPYSETIGLYAKKEIQ